ncbi:BA14K family protein [Rhizobium sp. RAF36]|uniref:BA14K family protein n=1 Tax=Rhizobium sp. RAF36 TaxID=3233055 RepID=UPI000DD54885
MKKLAILVISLATAFTGIAPAQAFPVVNIEKPQLASDIQQVRSPRIVRHRNWNNHHWNNGRYHSNYNRRYYRDGYYHRHNNNTGAIIGGLAAGAIIGGALSAASQPRYYGGNSHTRWCADRYRSYRASDNTFQPYNGPRQQCVGP